MKKMLHRLPCFVCVLLLFHSTIALPSQSAEPEAVWPDLAPGENTRQTGEVLPFRPNEQPPITRVVKISKPTFTVHVPDEPNGSAAIILPGGGFAKVVPDKEGTEAADWLNRHGVTAFVLSYRTTDAKQSRPAWLPPLQDIQRTIKVIRSRAKEWGLQRDRIGIVAFSAGGQVGARLLSDGGDRSYDAIDAWDEVSHRPDFAILVYPWQIYDLKREQLIDGVEVGADCPPTYLVHTHDDRSSSLGAVLFYVGLKKHNIASELHVYGNGGHGYGMRPVQGSQISSWTDHATHWLGTQGLIAD